MLAIMTPLRLRFSLLAVATVLAAALVGASPASNAYADGGNTRNCNQTGGGPASSDGLLTMSHSVICALNNITVTVTVGDVLSDNDVQILDDVIVKDNDICTSKGWDNNTCAVVILDDVTVKVLAFVNVIVKQIEVEVGDVKLIKKW